MQYVAAFDLIMLYIDSLPDLVSWALMQDGFLDCAGWQSMLDREGMPVSSASIGLLRRDDFTARCGTLLLWRSDSRGLPCGTARV